MNIGRGRVGESHIETIIAVPIGIPERASGSIEQYADVGRLTAIVPDITVEVSVEIAFDLQAYLHLGKLHDCGSDSTDILDAAGRSIGDGGVDTAEGDRFGS